MKIFSTLFLALSLLPASIYASTPNVPITLGTSGNFGLLAGSGITNVSSATIITGDVGSAPTPAVTGLVSSQVNGNLYLNPDPATTQAQVQPGGGRPVRNGLNRPRPGRIDPGSGCVLLFIVGALDRNSDA